MHYYWRWYSTLFVHARGARLRVRFRGWALPSLHIVASAVYPLLHDQSLPIPSYLWVIESITTGAGTLPSLRMHVTKWMRLRVRFRFGVGRATQVDPLIGVIDQIIG